ncbi:hypothetical protein ACSMX9_03450 [Streptomyces sp. LE64]|uniref:hypothetical protein n=1 Tax=Streptomyces sp. LE64 TaxID=3448653 RepID=UPI004042837E
MADDNPVPARPGTAGTPGRTRPDQVPAPGAPAPGHGTPPPPVASARFPDEPPPEPPAARPPYRPVPPAGAPGAELPGTGPAHPPRSPRRPPAPRTVPRAGASGYGYDRSARFDAPFEAPPPSQGRPSRPDPRGPAGAGYDDEPLHRLPADALHPLRAPADREDGEPRGFARYRAATATACAILGFGLIGGAVTGSWLTEDSNAAPGPADRFAAAAELWHDTPVDGLFPPTVRGDEAGPGGADRIWKRVAVAPDSTCGPGLDPQLRKALAPAGCERLVRATYTDATRSHLTTVGLLFTTTDAPGMDRLHTRFSEQGLDRLRELMPRAYGPEGTPAAGFGDPQRATWTLSVLTDVPVVVFAVSGFADGRVVPDPEPAAEAARGDGTSAPAQSGLGHEAKGLADRIERALRTRITVTTEQTS